MKSYCCRSPWCNCGYFEECRDRPPCCEQECGCNNCNNCNNCNSCNNCNCGCNCGCCCGCKCERRFCYMIPVEDLRNCGCSCFLSC